MKDLIIIGASGFGREVAWLVERINKNAPTWNLLGFLDDNTLLTNKSINNYPILGELSKASYYKDSYFICAIGSSLVRAKIVEYLKTILFDKIKFATLIDPSVIISDKITIGDGSIICAGTIATVNISMGKHTIINLDCTLGHDDSLSDYVTIYPSVNISGNVNIGTCTEIGTGSQIIQGITIGEKTIVGAGSVVIRNIPSLCTAVGSPAKPIKYHEQGIKNAN